MFSDLDATAGPGGVILAILAVLSLISLTVIVVKLIQLWRVTSETTARSVAVDDWSSTNRTEGGALSAGHAPASRVQGAAMTALAAGRPRQVVEAEAERLGNAEVQRMGRLLRLLEVIAMVSPLLGLLGTVLGMIQSFQELELAQGSANASVLAGGIWQALLTTAAGLIVAIPAAIAANLLAARVDAAAHQIEDAVARLLAADEG